MLAEARVLELVLLDGLPAARLTCPPGLVPLPGGYVLAHASGSDDPLPDPVFPAGFFADGFLAAPPVPSNWSPGTRLNLRGPLGRAFKLPAAARRVVLVAMGDSPRRLLALLESALQQNAAVTLVCENPPDDLPEDLEIQPLHALRDVCRWGDYLAFDAARETLPQLWEKINVEEISEIKADAQVLVQVPMPCGGLGACGVCTMRVRRTERLACEDGPVFELKALL